LFWQKYWKWKGINVRSRLERNTFNSLVLCTYCIIRCIYIYIPTQWWGIKGDDKRYQRDDPLHLLYLYWSPLTFFHQIIEKGNERDVWEENKKNQPPLDLTCQTRAPYDFICYLMELRGKIVTLIKAIKGDDKRYQRDDPLHLLYLYWSPLTFFHQVIEKGNERDVWEENKKNQPPLDLTCQTRAPYDFICYLMEPRGKIVTLIKAISEKYW